MRIINDANLPYAVIGSAIDRIIENGKHDTYYYGKVEVGTIMYKNKIINVQIRYLKKYVEWRFYYDR